MRLHSAVTVREAAKEAKMVKIIVSAMAAGHYSYFSRLPKRK